MRRSVKKFFSSDFFRNLLLLVVGFFLTSYIGNDLASKYQQRLWDHQHKVNLQESETEAASKIFEETSRLVDKRIYRMEKLNWWIKDNKDQERIEQQMDLYREVLYDWNDNWNRNRSLMERYFGKSVRGYYENDLHSAIKEAGRMLENYYYLPADKRKEEIGWEIDGRMGDLENKADRINLTILKLIQNQEVGIFNPEVKN